MKAIECKYCKSQDIECEETLLLTVGDFTSPTGLQISCNNCQADYTTERNGSIVCKTVPSVIREVHVREDSFTLHHGLLTIKEEGEIVMQKTI